MQKVSISAPSRVHISLLSLSENSYRKNGGIGFAFNGNNLKIECKSADQFVICSQNFISDEYSNRIIEKLENIFCSEGLLYKMELVVLNSPKQHSGFGTGTTLLLSSIEALLLLNGQNSDRDHIVKLSGRGGTSGIGINTYFEGGFVFDIGHLGSSGFKPSRENEKSENAALKLLSLNMPKWKLVLLLPNTNLSSNHLEPEVDFFRRVCPISKTSSNQIISDALMGVCGSIIEEQFTTFCSAINNIQKREWKKAEINRQGEHIKKIMHDVMRYFNCIGMSSMGPLLYFFYDQNNQATIDAKLSKFGEVITASINNSGREIVYD